MVSKHYETERHRREKFIDEHFGNGYIVDEFIVDIDLDNNKLSINEIEGLL